MTEVARDDAVVAAFGGGARVAVDFTEAEMKGGVRA
jgi:hypothetical protein